MKTGMACAAALAAMEVLGMTVFNSGTDSATQRGVYEVRLDGGEVSQNPFFDVTFKLVFTLPDGNEIDAEGFFAGNGAWACRAYCGTAGKWQWRSESNLATLDGKRGAFEVAPSALPGKLRKHPDDPRQFAYDNGAWFLHVGDTGYRYVTDTEPLWQQYIDEAAETGFTKIRTWFCRGRHDVSALFAKGRQGMELAYWNEIERRLKYALEKYPHIQFQLIPYGEDWPELARYGQGDKAAELIGRYAQARFSAFPNVHWCMSNDSTISDTPGGNTASAATIEKMGRDWLRREPWGTLLTNHQRRYTGYSFAHAAWSDITTLQDRDQVAGELIAKYVADGNDPVVMEEDRYGVYLSPRHDRFFFRRLMWAILLSGGHATYGGLDTHEPFAGADKTKGVQGYLTAVRDGRLDDGAADFKHIARFFAESGLTMAGLRPADGLAGNKPAQVKAAANDTTVLVYLQNADSQKPAEANVRETPAECTLALPEGAWRARWFDPRNGVFYDVAEKNETKFTAPFNGDAVLLLQK